MARIGGSKSKIGGSRAAQKRKRTAREEIKETIDALQTKLDLVEEKHNQLVSVFIDFSRHAENMTTLLHLHLMDAGLATKSKCSGCGMQVIYPNAFEEIQAFPVCPNRFNEEGEEVEKCLNGFSHIENPFDSDEDPLGKSLD